MQKISLILKTIFITCIIIVLGYYLFKFNKSYQLCIHPLDAQIINSKCGLEIYEIITSKVID